MFLLARGHAQRVYRKFRAATERATAVQDQVLAGKLRRNAGSEFGRDYHFDRIRTAADFRRQIPILDYEDHRSYIERVQAGNTAAMFGRNQRVCMFAMTSGTTDQPKYIPVTDAFLKEYRQGWNAFGIKALLDHPQAFLRRIVQVSSRMDETRSTAGIPCGAITGLMAVTQKRLVRKYYVAPPIIAGIDDSLAKYYTIMRLAVPADVSFLITASPATQLKLASTADQQREALIRDIHDGTLRPDLPVSPDIRSLLAPRLKPNPAVAGRLEALVQQHGRLLPRHYWDLGFLANWTGGTMKLYLQDFPEYFGETPVRDIGLLASEGRMSIPVDDNTPAGILDVTSHYYEFIPRDCRQEAVPETLRSHEVQVGEEYYILLTTSAGLYRYDIGDLVRVVDFIGQAPVIEFLNKGSHISSLAGEKLTEHQVILAMERAAERLQIHAPNFVLAACWDSPPFYRLHIESGPLPTQMTAMLSKMLEQALCEINVEYASKRHTHRLGAVELNLLPHEFLVRMDRRCADKHRKANEQYKHLFLYGRPGQDHDFPLQNQARRYQPTQITP